jgi:putative flavoprotein involved in K+ transport
MNVRSGRPGSGSVGVVVVGAGQAGLAVSYYLRAFGIEHVVLERGRVGESWRNARWDSFTLVTPNWMTRLPGHVLAGGTGADFISRDAIVGQLESFADGLPVTEGVEVVSVTMDDHGYLVTTPDYELSARAVVIAGGGQRIPVVPPLAAGLPPGLHQCDAFPGLYVAGYPWLSTRGSGLLYGVAVDAARIAQHIAATEKGTQAWTLHQPLCTLR